MKLKTQYGKEKFKADRMLNENPDYIGKFKKAFHDIDSLAVGYFDDVMYVNPNLHGQHDDLVSKNLIRNDFKYPGRLWTDEKIISFWKYPTKEELPKVLKDIEDVSDVKFDEDWMIEVVDNSNGYKDSDFISFEEYEGSPDWNDREFETEHEKSPILKTKKKPSYIKRKTIEDRLGDTSEGMKTFKEFNESLRDKMTPKSEEDVIDGLLKIQVGVGEYIGEIKNSILRYLEKNNIDVNDIIIIDDADALEFIHEMIQYGKDSDHFEETDADGMYFSYFNFFKDNIILMGDDSGELDLAIIYDINKFKEKLKPQKTKKLVEFNKFNVSLLDNTNNKDMQNINERVEVEMDIPQDVIDFQKLFDKKGYKLYIVGGAVRDYLMGKKPHDFDMVTDTTPQNVMDVLKDYRTDLQGVQFGVVRVFTQAEPSGYEIASYRKDISKGRDTKGNDQKVEIGQHITIKDDVKRRDLTMNALFYNIKTHEIVDVVGGMRDIQNKVVRAVGNPQKRFDEDRLRILRALRFAAITDSKLHPKTEKALRNDSRLFNISDVDDVSRERIFLEFKKVKEKARKNDDPKIIKRFVDDLIEYGIMEQIFPVITKHKIIRPTTYLTVAIAQVLRDNEITPEFKQILIDAKIPTDFVEIISILIKIWKDKVIDPNDVYELYKEVRNKNVRRDIIEEWMDVMNLTDKSLKTFLRYVPTTPGKEVMDDGFKGANIGHEIRRREAEKFQKMLNSNK